MDSALSADLIERERDGVRWYEFPRFQSARVRAVISSRRGGVSRGPFASLNLSFAVGDDPARVRENRRRFVDATGLDEARIICAEQVHQERVAYVDERSAGAGYRDRASAIAGVDGLITDRPGLGLWLAFADCVPILAFDPVRPAIGIAHAGWRGTLAGIARTLVEAMVEQLGTHVADLQLAIGPSIGPCCYVVGDEVVAAFRQTWSDAPSLFVGGGPSPRLDLWEANHWLLRQAGISEQQISVARLCTFCHVDRFFSHRAQAGTAGRIAAAIALNPGG